MEDGSQESSQDYLELAVEENSADGSNPTVKTYHAFLGEVL